MIKILSAAQTRQLDQFTIDQEAIPAIDLMERACQAFTGWFIDRFECKKKIGIICGPGNNGGDGLGIARLLSERGYAVKVWVIKGGQKETECFTINLERIKGNVTLEELTEMPPENPFKDNGILIDAIFGSGLSRPTTGIFSQIISYINKIPAVRVAVDIPSGLFADSPANGEIIQAHHTVSFQLPKLAFMFPENYQWVGQGHWVNIGLSQAFIASSVTQNYLVSEESMNEIIRPRKTFSHKGNYGHALVIAGSYGKIGASVLATKAALRSGAGLVTVHVPGCGYNILQTSVPEAMVSVDAADHYFSTPEEDLSFSSIGLGPGLGVNSETVRAFAKVMKQFKKPMVVDADALNMLAHNRELLDLIPEGSILTPHPKEFERIVGKWDNDFERLELLRKYSKQLKCIIILKGAYTSIASPDGRVHFNSTGNPGMATGGSGDVLTGVLTGLLAQGYPPLETALLGTYLHGLAGDIAASEKDMNSLIASDIVEKIPFAFQNLNRAND